MKYHAIFLVLIFVGFFSVADNTAFGLCMPDPDWPDAPCYGCPTCYPGIEQEKSDWEGYFEYKGEQWMNQKKNEMFLVIEQAGITQWLYHKSSYYSESNHNVWKYYYLHGEVPRENGKYLGEFDYPYQQPYEEYFEHSFLVVQCNDGLTLVIKNSKQTPACVTESTGNKLVLRNWGTFAKTANVINTKSDIMYAIRGGELEQATPVFDSFGNIKSIKFKLYPKETGLFSARIPTEIINTNPDYWKELVIKVDGVVTETEYHALTYDFKLFSVPFTNKTSIIEASLPDE